MDPCYLERLDIMWDSYDDEDGYGDYHLESNFREPAYIEEKSGLYTTEAQIRLFSNRPNGANKVTAECPEFQDWITMCEIYNILYDSSEVSNNQGYLYWDEKNECVGFAIIEGSEVHKILDKAGIILEGKPIKDEDNP